MFSVETADNGRRWTRPKRILSLVRAHQLDGHELVLGDVSSQWHAATGRVFATGKTFGWIDSKQVLFRYKI